MYSLSKTTSGSQKGRKMMEESEKLSVSYHDLFDYPLTFSDLIKWNTSKKISANNRKIQVVCQNNYYFLKGREGLIYKRLLTARNSDKKLKIAKNASRVLSVIPSVKMVAVTGSLAMNNSSDESDIDLMIITKNRTLWITRLLSYFVLRTMHYVLRSPTDRNQKNKLCLNMWMDENNLIWRSPRNIYTAHEIAQIMPLVNKNKTYEKFLYKNRWILKFWPNSVRAIKPPRDKVTEKYNFLLFVISFVENIAYKIQYLYMRKKITRELVTPTRAIFHPHDWGNVIISRLNNNGIF